MLTTSLWYQYVPTPGKDQYITDFRKLCNQDIFYNVIWRKGTQNPSHYLLHHAIPFSKLPKTIQKETSEFEKTVWFLQF